MAKNSIPFTQSATSGSYIVGKIDWESTSYQSSNTSTVTANIYVRKDSTTQILTKPTEGTWSYKINIGDNYITGRVYKSVLTDWVFLGSHTVSGIAHDAYGLKSIAISGSIVAPLGTNFEGDTTSGNRTETLDAIPRATTLDSLTCPDGYVNKKITANYTRQNSAYYNKCIVYVNVNSTLTKIYEEKLDQKSSPYYINFTTSHLSTIYSKVTNTTTALIRVTFQTFSDSNYTSKVGSDQSKEISLQLPLSVAPTIEKFTVSPVNSNSWLDSKNIYVAGLSSAKVEFSAKAGEGSKLKAKSIFWDDVEYGIAVSSSTINLTPPTKTGTITVAGTVRDYRDRTATNDESITVLSYSSPAVTSMTVKRGTYDNGWTAKNDGEDVQVKFNTNLSLGDQGNRYSVELESDANATTLKAGTTTGLESGKEYTVYLSNIDSETSHTLKLTATDSVGNAGVATITVQTKHITMEFHNSGKGIAFGKTSEEEAFECAMPAKFSKGVSINGFSLADFVVDQVTSGDWSYRKWYSGRCELYTYHRFTTAIDTQEGGIYRSQAIELSLPFKVSDITTVFDCSDVSVWASSNTFRETGGNSTVKYVLFKGAPYQSNQWGTHIHIKGKWK